jgi:hypothetical protein
MESLTFLLFLVLLVWFWQASLATRDRAIATARETCKHRGIQFLDGTASLQNIRPYYSRASGPGFKRTYTFEYSEDGITRQNGCIVMHNLQITTVLLDG